jgi:hypothetical protein
VTNRARRGLVTIVSVSIGAAGGITSATYTLTLRTGPAPR